jgi:hypothetical protein
MPIVLAIEPDRRQAANLTSIVWRQVGAELILADTTEGALDAIGNRVPDLVLVPALLSPQDDAALAAALRVIAAAARVRTLTIPVLASGTTRAMPGGMLAKWRRSRAASPEPDGCDPAVFGEQISAYLQEAAAERAELEEEPLEIARPTAIAPVAAIEPPATEPPIAIPPEPLVAQSVDSVTEDTTDVRAVDPVEQPMIDLSEELAGLSDDFHDDTGDGEPVGIYTIHTEPDEPQLDAFDLLPALMEPPAMAQQPAAAEPVTDAQTEDLFVEPPEPPRADIEPWVPMYLEPGRMWPALEGMPAETPTARTDQPDWIELVASLRQDLERRRTDPPVAAADPIAARPSDGSEADVHRLAKKRKPQARKSKPIQDEWGFFDPEQCGFSMLLAKLDEITEEADVGDC